MVAAETLLSPGGIGGYVLAPRMIGTEAGRLALRILDGEGPADIPAKTIEAWCRSSTGGRCSAGT